MFLCQREEGGDDPAQRRGRGRVRDQCYEQERDSSVPALAQVCKAVSAFDVERLTLGFTGRVVLQEGGHGRGDSTGVAGSGHDGGMHGCGEISRLM